MWADVQRDGRPAGYRWRAVQRRKVWLAPNTGVPCINAAKTRNPLKLAGVPQTIPDRSQPLVDRSSPYCGDMWRIYCCLIIFPIVATCLNCEDIARQSCTMVPRWRFLARFCVLYFQRAACNTFQTCIINSH